VIARKRRRRPCLSSSIVEEAGREDGPCTASWKRWAATKKFCGGSCGCAEGEGEDKEQLEEAVVVAAAAAAIPKFIHNALNHFRSSCCITAAAAAAACPFPPSPPPSSSVLFFGLLILLLLLLLTALRAGRANVTTPRQISTAASGSENTSWG